jgi:hypothetical protein
MTAFHRLGSSLIRALGPMSFVLLLGVSGARAEGTNQETINQFTVQIQAIEARDSDKRVTTEIGLAKAWLGEAQAQLTQDREEELARTVKRVRVSIALMEAKLKKVMQSKRTEAARAEAAAKAAAVEKARAEVVALEREIAQLSNQVESNPKAEPKKSEK